MCVTICGRFCPDEGAVAGYGNRIRVKYTAKWGVQIAGMIFQTGSRIAKSVAVPRLHSYTLRNPGKIMLCMVSHQIPGAVNYTKKRLAQSLLRFSNLLHKAFRDFMYYEILWMI